MNHINSNNTFQINPKNINNNINIQMNNNFGGKNMNNMNMNQNNMIMNNNNNKNGIQNINTTNLLNKLLLLFNKYFSDSNLSKLQTESQILAFFSKGEKKCISFIYSNFYEKEKYTSNIYKELENLFNNNPNLNHDLTKGINEIIKMIPFQNFDNLEKYNEALISVFGNVEVPYFLIRNDFENLKQFLQYSNRNNETSTISENIKKKNFGNNDTKIFIDYYEIIRNNILNPFEGFDKKIKLELFKLFLIINIRTLGKWYVDKHFIYFFESNINMINKYFENKLTFKEIKDFLDNNHANSTNLKEFLYQNISPSLGNNINNIYNIISSFFYILFYKFKDNNKPELISNIGNTHLSVAFKNFVIFFDNKNQIFANTGKNLFQLLTDLIAYEIYYLATYNKFNLQTNELYDFDRIDTILAEDEGYKILRESNIAKYPNMVNDDVVECIVALPGQLFYTTGIPVSLWILRKGKSPITKRKILFIDARTRGRIVDRKIRELSKEDIELIANTYHCWRDDVGYADVAGFCKSETIESIAANDYVLTPGRYVGVAQNSDDDESYSEKMTRLTEELAQLYVESDALREQLKETMEALGYGI